MPVCRQATQWQPCSLYYGSCERLWSTVRRCFFQTQLAASHSAAICRKLPGREVLIEMCAVV